MWQLLSPPTGYNGPRVPLAEFNSRREAEAGARARFTWADGVRVASPSGELFQVRWSGPRLEADVVADIRAVGLTAPLLVIQWVSGTREATEVGVLHGLPSEGGATCAAWDGELPTTAGVTVHEHRGVGAGHVVRVWAL